MKKKLMTLLIGLSLVGTMGYAAEIIPSNYLMERLIIGMEVTPTYISNDGTQEFKAVQIDNNILKRLQTTESPFYVYDSDGNQKVVRKGDYFVSPTRLSSIFVIDKETFEKNFRDKSLPEQVIETKITEEANILNPADVDAGSMDIKETERQN